MASEFEKNLEGLIEHSREIDYSSSVSDYMDCDAYRNIVAMGTDALLLIKMHHERIPFNFLVPLIKGIVGDDFQIPEEKRGRFHLMKDYIIKWLNKNLAKYI